MNGLISSSSALNRREIIKIKLIIKVTADVLNRKVPNDYIVRRKKNSIEMTFLLLGLKRVTLASEIQLLKVQLMKMSWTPQTQQVHINARRQTRTDIHITTSYLSL